MQEISVTELNTMLSDDNNLTLLDVREDWERDTCSIESSIHIPMNNIPAKIEELNKDTNIAVMCHHGMRSLQVCQYLESVGFTQLYNVTGGIDAWTREVDPSLQLY